jgi:hypothetical protein
MPTPYRKMVMSGSSDRCQLDLLEEALDLGRGSVRDFERWEVVTPSSRRAENHGFAAENSCWPARNPAVRGWEYRCSRSGFWLSAAAARKGLPY